MIYIIIFFSLRQSIPCTKDKRSRPGEPLRNEGFYKIVIFKPETKRLMKKIYNNKRLFQVLKKANIVQKKKTTEHTRTERQVNKYLFLLQQIINISFLGP